MEIRATLNLRNERMVAARERLGLSQKAAASLSGVGLFRYARLEMMNAEGSPDYLDDAARKIAAVLEIKDTDVLPPELVGKSIPHRLVRNFDIDIDRLLSPGASQDAGRRALPPGDTMDRVLDQEILRKTLDWCLGKLTWREREVLKMRWGLDGERLTLDECAKIFRMTRERIRQIEARGIRKLQNLSAKTGLGALAP